MCVCVSVCHTCAKRPEKGTRHPGAGIKGTYELSNTGAGNSTWVLWRSSKRSYPHSHLSSCLRLFFIKVNELTSSSPMKSTNQLSLKSVKTKTTAGESPWKLYIPGRVHQLLMKSLLIKILMHRNL